MPRNSPNPVFSCNNNGTCGPTNTFYEKLTQKNFEENCENYFYDNFSCVNNKSNDVVCSSQNMKRVINYINKHEKKLPEALSVLKASGFENKYGNNKPICKKYFLRNNHLPYTKITCNRDKSRFDLQTNTFQEYKNDKGNACIKFNKNS